MWGRGGDYRLKVRGRCKWGHKLASKKTPEPKLAPRLQKKKSHAGFSNHKHTQKRLMSVCCESSHFFGIPTKIAGKMKLTPPPPSPKKKVSTQKKSQNCKFQTPTNLPNPVTFNPEYPPWDGMSCYRRLSLTFLYETPLSLTGYMLTLLLLACSGRAYAEGWILKPCNRGVYLCVLFMGLYSGNTIKNI